MQTSLGENGGSSPGTAERVTWYHWLVVVIASCGWLFDCMDQRLFILAREPALKQLLGDASASGLDVKTLIGWATTAMMIGWATGGILFGMMSDKWGRVKTMVTTLLIYSGFTGLSGCATSWLDFMFYRFLVGLGVGGMFGAATTLVAESVPARIRSLALGSLQALSASGNIIGSFLSLGIKPNGEFLGVPGWRALFFVGILPSLLVIPIVFILREPEPWREAKRQGGSTKKMGSYAELLANPYWHITAALAALAGVLIALSTVGVKAFPQAVPEAVVTHQGPINLVLWLALLASGIATLAGIRTGGRASVGLFAVAILGVTWFAPADWPKREVQVSLVVLLAVAAIFGFTIRRDVPGRYNTRWRRNAVIGLFLGLAGMAGLWGIGFFSPELISTALEQEPTEVVDFVRGWGTALQDVGSFLGMMAFTLVATYLGRRLAFFGAFVLCVVVTIFVFYSLRSGSDAYWMLPMMGFAQLSVFGGYSIYFPELFPTRLRGCGVGFCYNTVRFLTAAFPSLLMSLNNTLVAQGVEEPFRKAAMIMSSIFVLGLVVLIWAPETKGQPLPEG